MSDSTPDAVAEATPETAPAPEPTTEGGPPVSPAPAEGGELDITTLPEQAQEYIKELREESRDRRKAYDPYKMAFAGYNDAEKEYLLEMVGTLSSDQEAGGKQMLDLAQRMLGIEQAAEAVEADPAVQEEAAKAGLTGEEVARMVKEQVEQERMIIEVEEETRALGIDPSTEDALALWDLASRLEIDDLSKVLAIQQTMNGEAPAPAAEPEPAPAAEFPATAAVPASTGGGNAEEPGPIAKLGSDELRAKVQARIAAASTPG